MTSKRFAVAVVLVGWIFAAGVSAEQRNVLLLISDDHGLQLGCYGDHVIQTPSLDRLAASGTRFSMAFATVASCSASRSVIYTGLHTHTNGQYGHEHDYHHQRTQAFVKSMPMLLNETGYRTGIIGKIHVGPPEVYPFQQTKFKGVQGSRDVIGMAEAADRFINTDKDKPFCLVIGYSDPHRTANGFGGETERRGVRKVNYDPEELVVPPFLPDEPEVREELVQYSEAVSRMDQGVGKVLEALDASGRADETLVIYISDNGIAFPGAKTTVYEPGIHLPMLVRVPGRKAGVVNQAMVSFVDIVPTVLDWAGVKAPYPLPGRSILPIVDQEKPDGWDVIFASHTFHEITMYYPMRVIRTRRYKLILNLAHQLDYPFASDLYASKTWQGVLRRQDKMFGNRTVDAYIHRSREELYDLENDPHELKNLAGDLKYAEVLSDLRGRLKEFQQDTKDPWIVKYRYE